MIIIVFSAADGFYCGLQILILSSVGLQIRRNGQLFSVSLDALGGEPWWSIRRVAPQPGIVSCFVLSLLRTRHRAMRRDYGLS